MASTPHKIDLRKAAVAARAALRGDERRAAASRVLERAHARIDGSHRVIGAYVAIHDELHPGPLLERLSASGHIIGLPATPSLTAPIEFRAWRPGEPLVRGRMNIPEPSPEAPEVFPDLLLVPPVAFDRRCYRIGYGAGFYDRTIPILRRMHPLFTLGLAFACQEVDRIPDEQHDVPLDAIATERELILPDRG
jgi:5-formyltetrahydrofolate cyclo-ligase